jgi:hypothetical protein
LYGNEDYIPAAPQVDVWEAGYRKGMTCKYITSMQNSILMAISILFAYNVADVVQVLTKISVPETVSLSLEP